MAQLNDLLVMGQSTLLGPVTLTGVLKLANGTWNHAGDDAYFGDNNTAGSFAIKGINGTTNLKMVQYDGANAAGTLSWDGSNFIFSNALIIKGATKIYASNFNIYSNQGTTSKFSIAAASGNTSIGGTLGVTGATTLNSTLNVTGNTSLGGTLGVTGATTVSSNVSAAGFIATGGTDLQLRGPAEGAGSDSGDIIFADSTGAEISRLWSSSNTLMFRTRTDLTGDPGATRYVAMANSSNVSGTSETTYLRNDGAWATPPDTNTTYRLSVSGRTVTLTDSNDTTCGSGTLSDDDDSVYQYNASSTADVNYNVLLTYMEKDDVERNHYTRKSASLYFNPKTGTLTSTKFNASSDKRLKENFLPFTPKKSILDLPIYTYDFISGAKNQIGCTAQELQEICPEIVDTDENGYLSIQESKIVYLLIDEIKKLKNTIQVLIGE